jgi:hypothetical protein
MGHELGPGSLVGIATRYELNDRGSNPCGAKFSTLVQTLGPTHPPIQWVPAISKG